jgi:hypothetical protein
LWLLTLVPVKTRRCRWRFYTPENGAFDAKPNGVSLAKVTCPTAAAAVRRGTPKEAAIRTRLGKLRRCNDYTIVVGCGPQTTIKLPVRVLHEGDPIRWIVVTRIGELVNVSSVNNSTGTYRGQPISRQRAGVVVCGNHDQPKPRLATSFLRVGARLVRHISCDLIIGRHWQSEHGIESNSFLRAEILRDDYSTSALARHRVIGEANEVRWHHCVPGSSTVV